MSNFVERLKPAEPSGPETLAKERSQSTLPVLDLANHLFEDGFLKRQDRILREVLKKKLFKKDNQQNLSRTDRFKLGLARAKLLVRMSKKLGWNEEDYKMAEYLVDDVSPYYPHTTMFVTTIRDQASDEQRAYWLPKVDRFEIIGAYAQTELGHGSNVKGIELQAKWDTRSKEFILHSPTLTSSKWWNGGLGRIATHAIVIAQLLIPEPNGLGEQFEYKSLGPHPFIVQVRDMKTHQALPGIAIGDIGAKYGYPCMDNAYMLFENFRLPHSSLLNRYSSLDMETGEYASSANSASLYGTMTYVRANIVMHARLALARAVTIAVRYLAVRHQFRDRDSNGTGTELPVLDYQTVQIRIFPLLAATFALHYSGLAMKTLYAATRGHVLAGHSNALANLHSTSSGLKSLCTTLAGDGIEVCRRAMGGHGYGGGTGLIQLNNDYLSRVTVEGDNWMITQQTAAYLIKKISIAITDPNAEAIDLLDQNLKIFLESRNKLQKNMFDIFTNDKAVVASFWHRASYLLFKAHEERHVKKLPWNSLLIQLYKVSKAHSEAILVDNFYSALISANSIPATATSVMWSLFRLFAFHTMEVCGREFYESAAVSNGQLDHLQHRIQDLMLQVRPHAVSLVDSWQIPDYLLDSALGRYDGKVYEDLFNRAHRLNPLNKETFNPYYWEEEIIMESKGVTDIIAKL